MSLLDDARRLLEAEIDTPSAGRVYLYCGGGVGKGHADGCDLAAVPRLVAVVEAAERAYLGWLKGNDVWGPMMRLRDALLSEEATTA